MAKKIPSDIIISDLELTHNIPAYKTTSDSEIVKVRDRGIHYITGTITLTSDSPRSVEGFLLGLKNSVETFDLELGGDRFNSQTITAGSPRASVAMSKGATKLNLTGFTGRIATGDVFNLLNSDKIYYVVEGGTSQITIYPPLREDVPINEQLSFQNVRITARIENSEQAVKYEQQGLIVSCDLDFREAL